MRKFLCSTGIFVLLMICICSVCLAKQSGIKKAAIFSTQLFTGGHQGHQTNAAATAIAATQTSIKEALNVFARPQPCAVGIPHHYKSKNYARVEVRCRSDT